MSQSACLSSKILCVHCSYIQIGNQVHVKSLGVTRGWQMPNPQAAQNLSSGTEKAGKCPGETRGAWQGWNRLMHNQDERLQEIMK